jgi:hypothetical protein
MRDPHVRFCERHGGVISRAYSTPAIHVFCCSRRRKSWMPACAGMTRLGRPSVNVNLGWH